MEVVNHPSHYNQNGFECIDVMRAVFGGQAVFDFCLLNAFKYLYRCNSKHETPMEDIKKAAWYLNDIIEHGNVEKIDDKAKPQDMLSATIVNRCFHCGELIVGNKAFVDAANEYAQSHPDIRDKSDVYKAFRAGSVWLQNYIMSLTKQQDDGTW